MSPTLATFLQNVFSMGLSSRAELRGILRRHISDELLASAGLDSPSFFSCPSCYYDQLSRVAYDAGPATDEIEERIIRPDREAQALFDAYPYLTRLYTMLSPEEMNIDPTFSFDRQLPEVSNVHTARVVMDCGNGGTPGSAGITVHLEDGSRFEVDQSGSLLPPVFDGLPASTLIERFPEHTVVTDNRTMIRDRLDREIKTASPTCGCGSTSSNGGLLGSATVALLLALSLAISRRRGL